MSNAAPWATTAGNKFREVARTTDYPDGDVELLPGLDAAGDRAVEWLSGAATLPPEVTAEDRVVRIQPSNAGVELVDAVAERAELRRNEFRLMVRERASADGSADVVDETRRMIPAYKVQLAELNSRIDQARVELWGAGSEGDSDGCLRSRAPGTVAQRSRVDEEGSACARGDRDLHARPDTACIAGC